MKRRVPLYDRVITRVRLVGSCWVYGGALNESGYGVVGSGGRGGKVLRTHRVMYEALVGPIAMDLELDHLCRNRACCNPDHLEPVTRAENIRRGVRKTGQMHCKQGHEFTPENTRQTSRQRVCKECEREIRTRYLARKKERIPA